MKKIKSLLDVFKNAKCNAGTTAALHIYVRRDIVNKANAYFSVNTQ
jgi:hypothetical protein